MDRRRQARTLAEIRKLTRDRPDLHDRLRAVLRYGAGVRSSEYHLTNACNLRCKGCWYFTYGHDEKTRDLSSLAGLRAFAESERERGINTALLIGGEPTLFPDRIAVFRDVMERVTVSTNGLRQLPYRGFENVALGVTLFGGGALDDELRGIRPGGSRITGVFDTALRNYEGDPRVGFIYAVTEDGLDQVEPTVRRIADNGNRVTFNFYSKYDRARPIVPGDTRDLLHEMLRVQASYPGVVMSHPYYIRALVSGESHWGRFGYDVCPSISTAHPANEGRMRNGEPYLPLFNAYASDMRTLEKCCTSGHCEGCRDSQAVHSWLLVSLHHFCDSPERLATWVEIAESYWSQFVWSPYVRAGAVMSPA